MFYSQLLLAKKGPLARLWLAAHWDRKLTKATIIQTDIKVAAGE
jgi:cohesin complex subunit SCC1